MLTKTICTGTDPNICNALVFESDNMPICDITGKMCEDYHLPTCEIKKQLSQMFDELREGV